VSYESRTACDRVLRFGVRVCCHCCSRLCDADACGEAVLPVRSRAQRWRQLAVHDGAADGWNQADPTFSGGLLGGFCWIQMVRSTGRRVTRLHRRLPSRTMQRRIGSRGGNGQRQNVTITEVAGSQTFTLTGTLSSAGSTMMGTYTSTAGRRPTAHLADTP